ncbi:hypothetical protein BpHYR1_021887 [Brachionus plicatilis]|uniref:Uncharacterized protein n=1 Tax=Brachionus plicatilis TaxID=10195 RepID=A0A3M7SMU7_BRAPC|nr:hypothetical protein BpHYR1_021887 [Brachionus plicatilis]
MFPKRCHLGQFRLSFYQHFIKLSIDLNSLLANDGLSNSFCFNFRISVMFFFLVLLLIDFVSVLAKVSGSSEIKSSAI